MRISTRRGIATGMTGLFLAAGSLIGAPAAQADPIVNESQWTQGNLGFNTYFTCIYTCQSYFMVSAKVNRQGPIGNTTATPRVGERFYVHAYTAIISPFTLNDSYKMRLLFPEGLRPDIRSDTDVQCAITDLSFNVSRQIGPAECQDPVKVGVQWEFPNVFLTDGEAVSFFVPVVADRTYDGSQKIQLTSDAVNNPYTLLPDPVLSELPVVVNAAPTGTGGTGTGGTGTGGTPGTGGTGTDGTGTRDTPGTSTPSVATVPAKLVGAKKLKSLTPKVCKITGKGKKAKVTVLKSGKCKLTGKKGKKKVKASFRVNK